MAKGPMVRGGLPELLRQARRVQEKLEKVKEELKEREETIALADGKVTVTVTGERRVKSVKIDPSIMTLTRPWKSAATAAAVWVVWTEKITEHLHSQTACARALRRRLSRGGDRASGTGGGARRRAKPAR